ncbi:MAG: hypothetical protein K6D38_04050 [Pseudobutyrivibrio sp.]|nr:hypothetical protein [Pseudobutyrivibrio sp.]
MGQHRDIKLNFDDLGEIKNEIKNYIDALEDLQDASERFVSVIDEQKGDTFTELRKEYDDCISVDHSDLIEILYNVHDNLGNYMRDMQDLIAPENSGMLCRVDRNDIWWNLEQIKAIPHQCLSDHPSVPSHSYFDEFVNPLSPKAAEIQARNEEKRRRRERNYNKLVDFYNNVFYPTMDSIKDDIKKMYEIYDEYVVEYENTDDIYAKKLDEIYDSIKTWKDVAGDIWDGTKSFFKGFGTGIVDLAKGLKAPLEVSMAINVPLPLGMRLALLNDGGQEIYRGVKTFIKDPENNAGAIFQGMADTADEEGVAFTAGYATEKVAEIILAKKLADKISGPKVEKNQSFGDLMTPEEAVRYDDYWRKTNIGSNKTYDEFLKYNPGKDIDDYFRLVREQSPWPDGYNSNANKVTLKSGDTFNMVLDSRQKTSKPGGFGIKEDVPSVEFARNDIAIKYGWKDDCGKIATYRVKEGVELTCPSGPIGPQIDLTVNKYLPGNMGLTQYDLFSGLGMVDRNMYIEVVPGTVRRLR